MVAGGPCTVTQPAVSLKKLTRSIPIATSLVAKIDQLRMPNLYRLRDWTFRKISAEGRLKLVIRYIIFHYSRFPFLVISDSVISDSVIAVSLFSLYQILLYLIPL